MAVQQINDLTLVMQNVLPAQVYSPAEPQREDMPTEIDSGIPEDKKDTESRRACSCVDTYA